MAMRALAFAGLWLSRKIEFCRLTTANAEDVTMSMSLTPQKSVLAELVAANTRRPTDWRAARDARRAAYREQLTERDRRRAERAAGITDSDVDVDVFSVALDAAIDAEEG
ncbi:MAG: hypothetical protein ACT6Q8_24360 [Niveispirillum sp.]|uniref:hypothetical protein n=1 Tax=Niveispirillum sp. TaxID=1917217 RepID=UPI0040362962